jgi:hypothetical protein
MSRREHLAGRVLEVHKVRAQVGTMLMNSGT